MRKDEFDVRHVVTTQELDRFKIHLVKHDTKCRAIHSVFSLAA